MGTAERRPESKLPLSGMRILERVCAMHKLHYSWYFNTRCFEALQRTLNRNYLKPPPHTTVWDAGASVCGSSDGTFTNIGHPLVKVSVVSPSQGSFRSKRRIFRILALESLALCTQEAIRPEKKNLICKRRHLRFLQIFLQDRKMGNALEVL